VRHRRRLHTGDHTVERRLRAPTFDTEANAISGYAVDGNTLFENVSVGSASDSGVGRAPDVSASAITSTKRGGDREESRKRDVDANNRAVG